MNVSHENSLALICIYNLGLSKSKHVTGKEGICNDFRVHSDHKAVLQSPDTEFNGMAIVGFDAMQRANSTLEDFVSRDPYI